VAPGGYLYRSWKLETSYLTGVLQSTHLMKQASSKWISQVSSDIDAGDHAWHVMSTFLTFDNSHNLIYFD